MDTLDQLWPEAPLEILNLIWSYEQEGPIHTYYGGERWVHRIQWEAPEWVTLSGVLLVQRWFPLYWLATQEDDRFIYRYLKRFFSVREEKSEGLFVRSRASSLR